jgi:hypothetical protein
MSHEMPPVVEQAWVLLPLEHVYYVLSTFRAHMCILYSVCVCVCVHTQCVCMCMYTCTEYVSVAHVACIKPAVSDNHKNALQTEQQQLTNRTTDCLHAFLLGMCVCVCVCVRVCVRACVRTRSYYCACTCI